MAAPDVQVKKTCYTVDCPNPIRWTVSSEKKDPTGRPLSLYTCDDHCDELTDQCRKAGMRYLLQPLVPDGVSVAPSPAAERPEETTAAFKGYSWPVRVIAIGAVIVVGIVIGPFVIAYYLYKSLYFDWKPPKSS